MNITANTTICAIIGDPIKHSFSPVMHNAGYKKLNLDFKYVGFNVKKEQLQNAINGIRALNIKGVSITIPHKQSIIPFLDEIDETAKKIGAVNTIINNNGILKGYNTDWEGCMQAILEKTPIKNKKIGILGAGGAARAIAFGIHKNQGQLIIFNRSFDKAKSLAKDVQASADKLINFKNYKLDIIINATPVGMYPLINNSPLLKENIHESQIVMDTIYNPHETKLISIAKQKGAISIYGYKMLLYQGVKQFEMFTNQTAPIKTMEKTLLQAQTTLNF